MMLTVGKVLGETNRYRAEREIDLKEREVDRYARHILLPEMGAVGQAGLKSARVLVIGAGGLGSPVVLYLAAAGIGNITIADEDCVELSNLQRQIAHSTEMTGVSKGFSAAIRARALNPLVCIDVIPARVTHDNVTELVAPFDVICDGTDNFSSRFSIADACFYSRKTLVSAAIRRFEAQISVFKPHAGPALPCYRCFVGNAPQDADGGLCSEFGVLGTVAGVAGAMQANEVIKELLGLGESLAGRLLLCDTLNARYRTITVAKDPSCMTCGELIDHGPD